MWSLLYRRVGCALIISISEGEELFRLPALRALGANQFIADDCFVPFRCRSVDFAEMLEANIKGLLTLAGMYIFSHHLICEVNNKITRQIAA